MSDRSKAKSKKGGEDAHVSGPAVEFLEHHLAFETGPDKVDTKPSPSLPLALVLIVYAVSYLYPDMIGGYMICMLRGMTRYRLCGIVPLPRMSAT